MYIAIELDPEEIEASNQSVKSITNTLNDCLTSTPLSRWYITQLGVYRDDWERGDECPECGSDRIKAIYVGSDICTSKAGEWEYHSPGPYEDNMIRFDCEECQTRLHSNAVGDLME